MARGKKSPLNNQRSANLFASLQEVALKRQAGNRAQQQYKARQAVICMVNTMTAGQYGTIDNVMRLLQTYTVEETCHIIKLAAQANDYHPSWPSRSLVNSWNNLSPSLLQKRLSNDKFFQLAGDWDGDGALNDNDLIEVLGLLQVNFANIWDDILAQFNQHLIDTDGQLHLKKTKELAVSKDQAFEKALRDYKQTLDVL
jgi:hypothetical protein